MCKMNSKTRGLGARIHKGNGLWDNLQNFRGFLANFQGF
jgi:hypothetical protein